MPSFDVISEVNLHEVRNAIDQANRELQTRFDFKDAKASFTLTDTDIMLEAVQEFHLQQMMVILRQKLVKRQIDLAALAVDEPVQNLHIARQRVGIKQGIDSETAKRMVKELKTTKLKVQTQIQGEQLRVTGKKRDDLQAAITALRQHDWQLPIQMTNFRD
jgi:hypothetical protein